MNQILNIFRKDARHLRIEILASLVILLLFILIEPKVWLSLNGSASNTTSLASFLVIVSWGILILRLVHAERLAGLNQFWTTRPYEWPKLLAAKALFIALFVYVPFLLAQLYLLHHAGLSIAANLGPILHNLLLLTCVAVLPMVCIAVVTTSFGQAVLSILAIAVALIGLQYAFVYLGSVSATFGLPRYLPLFILPLELAIALIFLGAAVLLQYSRRVTLKSIAILAAAAVLLVLTPQLLEGGTAAASGYAAVPDAPATVTIDTSQRHDFSAYPRNPRTAVYRIPLQFSNFTPGILLSREAIRYTLQTPDGYTWTSAWLSDNSDFGGLAPKESETIARTRTFMDIPLSVIPRVVGRPVSLRIEFLGSQLTAEAPYTYTIATDPQVVPDLGVCALDDNQDNIYCRAPFGDFGFATVSAMGSRTPCEASPDTPPIPGPPIPQTGFLIGPRRWNGSWMPVISPVMANLLRLNSPHDQPTGHPCPGTPITFTVRHAQRRIYLATPPVTLTLNTPPPGGRVGP